MYIAPREDPPSSKEGGGFQPGLALMSAGPELGSCGSWCRSSCGRCVGWVWASDRPWGRASMASGLRVALVVVCLAAASIALSVTLVASGATPRSGGFRDLGGHGPRLRDRRQLRRGGLLGLKLLRPLGNGSRPRAASTPVARCRSRVRSKSDIRGYLSHLCPHACGWRQVLGFQRVRPAR